ncbi:MAG: DinB family protein [Anaerolineae bacterium]
MQPKTRQLMTQLFESRLQAISDLLEMDLTLFDRDLKHRDDWPSVTEYLCRLSWHEDDHAQEIARLKGKLGRRGLMEGAESYPLWFLREALLARARLLAELIDLDDEDLEERASPEDRSIAEVLEHLINTERDFLVDGVRCSIEQRKPTDKVFGRTRGERS